MKINGKIMKTLNKVTVCCHSKKRGKGEQKGTTGAGVISKYKFN
jgi:hypothetical protein